MSVVNLTKLNMKNVVIKSPIKHTKCYHSDIIHKKQLTYLQISTVPVMNTSEKFKIGLSVKQSDILYEFERYIIQDCVDNSLLWFGSELSFSQVSNKFVSLINDGTLSLRGDNYRVFDKDSVEITRDDVNYGDIVTVVIMCTGVSFWSGNITYGLQLSQLKKHINPIVDVLFIDSDSD
jgi:hypothetical protein